MNVLSQDISAFPLISFFVAIVGLYGLLFALRNYLPLLIKNKYIKTTLLQSFNFIELAIWIGFLLIVIPFFITHNFAFGVVFSAVVFSALLFLAWFAGRDLIGGFILRSNAGFKVDSQIQIGDHQGIIVKMYARNFKILSEKGDQILIPYSSVIGRSMTFVSGQKHRKAAHIKLSLPAIYDLQEAEKMLTFQIVNHPLSVVGTTPIITEVSRKNQMLEVDVLLTGHNSTSLTQIEFDLNRFVTSLPH
jgi:hypothetical protein